MMRVPAPVLGEICRGPRFDAAICHVLNDRGILVEPLTEQIARRAGALLSEARMSILKKFHRRFRCRYGSYVR